MADIEMSPEMVKSAFAATRKLVAYLLLGLLIIGVVVTYVYVSIGVFIFSTSVKGMLLGLGVLGIPVFIVSLWRCPSCKKHLGVSLSPDHCTHCGMQLT